MTGIIVSIGCLYFCRKYLPLNIASGVKFSKLVTYPLYLIQQIYLAGFHAIGIVLTDAEIDIVEIKTNVTNNFLRVLLANSITLIPGSISLDLKDETITVLWLEKKQEGLNIKDVADGFIKGKLEGKLLKAQE